MTARQRSRAHAHVCALMARNGLDRSEAIAVVAGKISRPAAVVLDAFCKTERLSDRRRAA